MKTWTVEIRLEFNPTFREPFRKTIGASSLRVAVNYGLRQYWIAYRKRLTKATIKVRREG